MNTTRQQLIEAAFRLFYRQGFHATGVDALAQEAGVTKRTLYSYFATKEDLVLAALEYRDAQFLEKLNAALTARPPAQTMEAYADFLIAWSREKSFNGCAFINASAEYASMATPAHRTSDEHKRKLREILRARIAMTRAAATDAAANALLLLGEGYVVMSQISASTAYRGDLLALAETLAIKFGLHGKPRK